MEEVEVKTSETQLIEFSLQVKANYDLIDTEDKLNLDLDLEKLTWIVNTGFGLVFHKVVEVRADGNSVRLKLEKR